MRKTYILDAAKKAVPIALIVTAFNIAYNYYYFIHVRDYDIPIVQASMIMSGVGLGLFIIATFTILAMRLLGERNAAAADDDDPQHA